MPGKGLRRFCFVTMDNKAKLTVLPPGNKDKLRQRVHDLESTLLEQKMRLKDLEIKTEKRQRPKMKVINTHKSFVKTDFNNNCPCCMKTLKDPQVDHFHCRSWGGLHDTWLICGQCNRDLYHGQLIRAEILPRFTTYQSHLKNFIGGEQLPLLLLPKDKS